MAALRLRLGRIRRFTDNADDSARYSSLFATKHGKKLGRQLTDLRSFVFTMTMLNAPFSLLQKEWVRLWQTGQVEELKEYSDSPEGFAEMDAIMRIMSGLSDRGELSDTSHIVGKREVRRLLALLTFSASAYLDSYLGSVVSTIEGSPGLARKVTEYLSICSVSNKRTGELVTGLKQARDLGSNQLVELLYTIFDVERVCSPEFMQSEILRYRGLLAFFTRLRGRIAHGDPEPSLRRFDHELFSDVREMFQQTFGSLWQVDEVPPPVRSITAILQRWLKGIAPTLSIVFAIPLLVALPACLLDVTISYNHERI